MKKSSLSIFFLLFSLSLAEDKIAFVFELVRHGARSGLIDVGPGYFSVPQDMLTASGMRQRYI
jgi:hypothetical protein